MIASLRGLSMSLDKGESAMGRRRLAGMCGLMRIAVVFVVAVVFGMSGLVANVEAAVSFDNGDSAMTIVSNTTTSTTPSGTIAKGTGSNRLLLVYIAVGCSTASNPNLSTATVRYGGQDLTMISAVGGARSAIWAGYLKEAGIVAATNTTITTNLPVTGIAGTKIVAGVFQDVLSGASDNPISDFAEGIKDSYDANPVTASSTLTIPADGYGIVAVAGNQTAATNYTWSPASYEATAEEWADATNATAGGSSHAGGASAVNETISATPNGSARLMMIAVALNPGPICSATPVTVTPTAVGAYEVSVDWGSDTGTTSYQLFGDENNPPTTSLGTGLTPPYSHTSLNANTTYYYFVRQTGDTACTVDSAVASVTTPAFTAGTTTGVMTFSNVGLGSMDVTVSYTGDDDNNNSLTQFQYATNPSFTSPVNISGATRSGKSWGASVSGLSESTTYYFRATFADSTGGVTGTNPVTGSQATKANQLMHSKAVLGSRYNTTWGNFTCTTCHTNGTTSNIKRIRATVSASGKAYDGFGLSASTADGNSADYATETNTNKTCDVCHTVTSVYKRDAANSGAVHPSTATSASAIDCIQCHEHRRGFKVNAGCVSCHAQNLSVGIFRLSSGAPAIVNTATAGILRGESWGGHLKVKATDILSSTMNWDAQCQGCHSGHYEPGGVLIPNNNTVGISYGTVYNSATYPTPAKGIQLGGTATSGSTEAEICWNCHDSEGVSEWGTNTDTNSGSFPDYDFGKVYTSSAKTTETSRWIGSYWTSANFTYKEGWLNNKPNTTDPVNGTVGGGSTHAATTVSGKTRQGVDDVDVIRCSYCHDVHNTANLKGTVAGDVNGKPYLRGTWMGNPYKEDGAPQLGTNYNNANSFGRVPRGSNSTTQLMGGFWIDQNSGNPASNTAYDTYAEFGGLCQLCHGTSVNTLNQYGNEGATGNNADWVSNYNGHKNAVKGASGPGTGTELTARNIFDGRGGGTTNYNGYMGYWGNNEPGDSAGGIRSGDENSFEKTPAVWDTGGDRYANTNGDNGNSGANYVSDWDNLAAISFTGTTTNANYHTFTCSKCHTPHASRLPRLMITNCLDTKHNTWDNAEPGLRLNTTTEGIWKDNTTATVPTILQGRTASNWTTAQNCHRLAGDDPDDSNDTAGNGVGWNRVTSW